MALSVRLSVCSVIHNSCGQDIPRIVVCTLHMERGRSLFFFMIKGQSSRSLDLYKEFENLDPCGQDIAKVTQT